MLNKCINKCTVIGWQMKNIIKKKEVVDGEAEGVVTCEA